jgi:transcriptional regulator with XRE-family HTH domain
MDLSQDALARASDVRQSEFSRAETGVSNTILRTLAKLGSAVDRNLLDLLMKKTAPGGPVN